ncbi:hypothetical protein [Deinococcus sp. S9]|uniref:hypothetical protein n=1 Tax=Deinococcus sp. S9 TaxID=2545754 RepID=UPI0010542847|nr:hypothetical protein [Deinococcus sp. S9]TDE85572.1 hypothetical protein E0686_11205 [Deinococcus sp. S9]
MPRPATLGGDAPPRSQPGTGSVEADFLEAYQDPQTRQWLGRVRLDGGRVLEGVRFGYPGSRASVGSRPPLPAKGERGIVLYPSSARQVRLAYWLCSIDHYTHGPDIAHPDEALQMHPSGMGTITGKDGDVVFRYANGDRIIQDDAEGDPPAPHYRPRGEKVAKREAFSRTTTQTSRWLYDGLAGGKLFGAQLRLTREAHGLNRASEFLLDQEAGFFRLKMEGDRGGAELAGDVEAGHLSLEVSRGGGEAVLDLDAQQGTIRLEVNGVKLEFQSNAGTAQMLASQLLTLQAQTVSLDAALVRAGQGATIPVALSSVVDANFRILAALHGLTLPSTAARKLVAL